MRKIFVVAFALAVLSLCGYAWADVNITAENFPDQTFRDYFSSNFDTDEDNTLTDSLTMSDTNHLAGINLSHNANLVFLHFAAANVSQLDLSSNSALLYTDLSYGSLASVELSGCTNLFYLNVSNNRIESISLNGNTALHYLNCASNDLAGMAG